MLSILVFSLSTFAINGKTTYQAKIIKPDGQPLQSASVNFRFTVLDQSGSCVLYIEDYSAINMTDTAGLISFPLGSGVRAFPTSGTAQTFQNTFDNSIASFACQNIGIYNPNSTDTRKIVMQFNDGGGWQTLPAMSINAVPYSMFATRSDNSRTLNNKADTAFVEYATLNGLSCAADQAIKYNGTSFSCITVGASATVMTSSTVVTALGYTPADGASFTALDATVTSVSSTVYSVSSTVNGVANSVTSLSNSVAASFAAITSSQWSSSGTTINYMGGLVGIGTTTPATKLDVSGGVRISMESAACSASLAGTIRYNAANLEYCNGTSWATLGVAGSGITNFNGSTSGTQTFATGITGTVFSISSVNGVHTFNIPLAASGSVTAGLLSNVDYVSFTNKVSATSASVISALGYTPASATTVSTLAADLNTVSANTAASFAAVAAASGTYALRANNLSDLASATVARTNLGLGSLAVLNFIDLSGSQASGTLAAARLPAFSGDASSSAGNSVLTLASVGSGVTSGTQYTKVTVDGKGRVTSGAQLSTSDVTTALGYTPASATASTQWTTAASNIYYNSGNVGVGVTNPATGRLTVTKTSSVSYALDITSSDPGVATVNRAINLNMSAGQVNQSNTGIYLHNANSSEGSATGLDLNLNARDSNLGVKINVTKNWFGSALFGTVAGVHSTVGTDSSLAESYSGYFTNTASTGAKAYGLYVNSNTGATDAAPLVVAAQSTEVFRVSVSGNVGVGTATPSARLHLAAGSTTKAPLKFTSGTLLTAPQSGTMEYDGVYFYVTDGAGTRRSLVTDTGGNYSNVNNISAPGNITLTPTGSVVVSSTTASTSSNNGALVVAGGLGVGGSLNVAGVMSGSSTIKATGYRANQGAPNSADSSTVGYAFGQDGDTGMFSPGVNSAANGIVAIYNNDVETMRISPGTVGIGTASAAYQLDTTTAARFSSSVSGGVRIGSGQIRIDTNSDAGSALKVMATQLVAASANSVALGYTGGGLVAAKSNSDGELLIDLGRVSSSGSLQVRNTSAGEISVNVIGSTGSSTLFASTNTGRVGIGTTAPADALHVAGAITAANVSATAKVTLTPDFAGSGFLQSYSGPGVFRPLAIEGMQLTLNAHGSGTTITGGKVHIAGTTQNVLTTYGSENFALTLEQRYGAGGWGPALEFRTNDATHTWTNAAIASKDPIDGSYSGALAFFTTPGGAVNSSSNGRTKQTHLIERMRISQTGNVGIGTTSPANTLSVSGTKGDPSSFGNGALGINGGGVAALLLGTDDSSLGAEYAWIQSHGSRPLYINKVGNNTILNSGSGYVGIGITSPTAMLEVKGAVLVSNVTNGSTSNIASLNSNSTNGAFMHLRRDGSNEWFMQADPTAANALHFRSGNLTGTPALSVLTTGNVGVGTSNPTNRFEVRGGNTFMEGKAYVYSNSGWGSVTPSISLAIGDNDTGIHWIQDGELQIYGNNSVRMHLDVDGRIGIGNTDPQYKLDVTGTIRGVGITDSSDVRLKENIAPLAFSLEKILQVQGVNYYWKDKAKSERLQIGFIAQQIEKIYPELVETDGHGMKSVNYSHLVAPLVEAVKVIYQRITGVEREIASLKAENEELKTKVKEFDELKAYICKKDSNAPNCK